MSRNIVLCQRLMLLRNFRTSSSPGQEGSLILSKLAKVEICWNFYLDSSGTLQMGSQIPQDLNSWIMYVNFFQQIILARSQNGVQKTILCALGI